jgi:ATP-dependent helicase/nuclease subunit A
MNEIPALPETEDPGVWIGWTTIQQAIASDPARSAWVSANAGSGKTHVRPSASFACCSPARGLRRSSA